MCIRSTNSPEPLCIQRHLKFQHLRIRAYTDRRYHHPSQMRQRHYIVTATWLKTHVFSMRTEYYL